MELKLHIVALFLSRFPRRGSGFVFDVISNFTVTVAKYQPSAYGEL